MSLLSTYLPRGMVPLSSFIITEDITLNYDTDLLVLVVLVGGGGSGGAASDGNLSNAKMYATGGAGGNVAIQLLRMEAGTDYAFTIGSGGAAQGGSPTSRTAYSGVQGGSTALDIGDTGTDDIIATGGMGGVADSRFRSYTTNWAFIINPDPSPNDYFGEGADLIYRGGRSGLIFNVQNGQGGSNSYTRGVASGGGAANVLGVPVDLTIGGNVSVTDQNGGHCGAAGGGGSVSGAGGHAINQAASTNATPFRVAAGGGGTGGPAPDADTGSSPTAGNYSNTGGIAFPFGGATLIAPDGAGADGSHLTGATVPVAGPGAGGAGVCADDENGNGEVRGGEGGIFGGGGGAVDYDTSSSWDVYGGAGGLGGGGGGACTNPKNGHSFVRSGAGGGGCALVYFYTDFGKVRAS